ncbi:MAG: 2-amino-4-hydroxy-6-hydroxymethyldihydropteridine diphosphokinase [Planctomycetes bacterium]|nr:2-amino-4-hydroxy-6-hydroxymethyldihydropteridine diphosphokinase [Planctomycetota bacterium]MCB9905817.1 2-amino-4-hydroxy-6-hydroxymethyldihydropteridine diphosphokinase [Planctomycetota bacterium]
MNGPWRRGYVALGSNLGNREAALESALVELDATPGVRVDAVSRFHRTAPVGGPAGQGEFVNAVARVRTRLAAEDLLAALQAVEARHGRDRAREVRNGPRTLDLDLLLLEGETRDTEQLQLPHPRMEDRLFVLEPLEDLDPALILPRCGRSVRDQVAALRAPEAVL